MRLASVATSTRLPRSSLAPTDTHHGSFAKLVPNEQVVEVVEFETTDPGLRGEMTITITLTDYVAVGSSSGAWPSRWRMRWRESA